MQDLNPVLCFLKKRKKERLCHQKEKGIGLFVCIACVFKHVDSGFAAVPLMSQL